VREVPYVDAAQSCVRHARIMLRHMVPNVITSFLILLSAFVGQPVLAEGSMSYLGLGVQEPVPALGPDTAGRGGGMCHDGSVDRGVPGGWPSCSACSASACSVIPCATPSIPSCATGREFIKPQCTPPNFLQLWDHLDCS
jgi:hypothetical protein